MVGCNNFLIQGRHTKVVKHWSAITGGLNHLPYLLSISVSMVVIKDFSTNYMKALRLNQAYILLKLCNNYYRFRLYTVAIVARVTKGIKTVAEVA